MLCLCGFVSPSHTRIHPLALFRCLVLFCFLSQATCPKPSLATSPPTFLPSSRHLCSTCASPVSSPRVSPIGNWAETNSDASRFRLLFLMLSPFDLAVESNHLYCAWSCALASSILAVARDRPLRTNVLFTFCLCNNILSRRHPLSPFACHLHIFSWPHALSRHHNLSLVHTLTQRMHFSIY